MKTKKPNWIMRRIYNILFLIEGSKRMSYEQCPYCQHFLPYNKNCPVCNNYIENIDKYPCPPTFELKLTWMNNFIEKILYKG